MFIKPIKIKDLVLKGNIFLSPMAEITDYAFRIICLKNGCDMAFSEMISAKSLHYRNKKSLESLKVRDDRPLCLQIFGSEVPVMVEAALMVQDAGADMVEINAGCPVKKIVKTKSGAALMKDYSLLSDIVKSISSRVRIPVSVKIRAGYDDNPKSAVTISKILQDSGASVIHIHLRTVEQYHSGDVNYEVAKLIKESVKIPIIVNGGVKTPKDFKEMILKTGGDCVSIGRGAVSNPFIFDDIKKYFSGERVPEISIDKRIKNFIEYLSISALEIGEKGAIVKSRRIAAMLLSGFRNACDIRTRYMKAKSLDEAKDILGEWLG